MGTGVSLFFIAVGAILTFAVQTRADGIDLDATGVILMVIGLIGLLWSLMINDWRPLRRSRDDVVVRDAVDDDVVIRRDPVVIDEDAPRTVRRVYR